MPQSMFFEEEKMQFIGRGDFVLYPWGEVNVILNEVARSFDKHDVLCFGGVKGEKQV